MITLSVHLSPDPTFNQQLTLLHLQHDLLPYSSLRETREKNKMDKPIKVTKRRNPNTLLEASSLPKSTLNTRLHKVSCKIIFNISGLTSPSQERRKSQHLEAAAATFHGVASALVDILERGGLVFNEKNRKCLRQRSQENSRLFKLFVSESRDTCNRAVNTLEVDQSSFEAKSNTAKKDL